MISVIYITARAPNCYHFHPEWNQYEQLAANLAAQTYHDFEVIVVTPQPEVASRAFDGLRRPLLVTPPIPSPWRRARMFCAASARNTGLIHAQNDLVLVLDDCTELPPTLLSSLAFWWQRGICVGLLYQNEAGEFHDLRAKWFDEHCDAAGVVRLHRDAELLPPPQGMLTFPLQAAIDLNGYDQHFDGARGLEDVEFSRRLLLRGVPYVYDRQCMVTLHQHDGYPDEVINNDDQGGRCCNPTYVLAMGRNRLQANRTHYTEDETRQILECMFWQDNGTCGYHGLPCPVPRWAKGGHPVARRIMRDEGEPLFDLAAERWAVGL